MQFVQTLDEIHKTIKGWGQSYSFCNAIGTMADLDSKIGEEIEQFVATYLALGRGASPAMHRLWPAGPSRRLYSNRLSCGEGGLLVNKANPEAVGCVLQCSAAATPA